MLAAQFAFDMAASPEAAHMQPRYNIAPTQPVAVVREHTVDGGRALHHLYWGLIPSWTKDPTIGNRMINARGETVAEKPSFRTALRRRRCLILADGFYEWAAGPEGKVPHHIHRIDGRPFAFAGLWEHWMGPNGEEITSCTIITTTANAQMTAVHRRMPVILPEGEHARWLSRAETPPAKLLPLLAPRDWEGMTMHPVSTYVNNPRNEGPQCTVPAP